MSESISWLAMCHGHRRCFHREELGEEYLGTHCSVFVTSYEVHIIYQQEKFKNGDDGIECSPFTRYSHSHRACLHCTFTKEYSCVIMTSQACGRVFQASLQISWHRFCNVHPSLIVGPSMCLITKALTVHVVSHLFLNMIKSRGVVLPTDISCSS